MARPVLTICRRCERDDDDSGEALFQAVKALRKARGLKPVFKVKGAECLHQCRWGLAVELEGKKRSTYLRIELREADAEALVETACAYARLEPGEELPERRLPGTSGD